MDLDLREDEFVSDVARQPWLQEEVLRVPTHVALGRGRLPWHSMNVTFPKLIKSARSADPPPMTSGQNKARVLTPRRTQYRL